jgi:hypothetical protein
LDITTRSSCCKRTNGRRSLLCGGGVDIRVDDSRLWWRWTWSLVLFVMIGRRRRKKRYYSEDLFICANGDTTEMRLFVLVSTIVGG